MTERKWTPGPWCAHTDDLTVLASDDQIMADVYGGRRAPHNAHLIAAAPDLYEALDVSLIYLECCCDTDGNDAASIVLRAARAALAKARGDK